MQPHVLLQPLTLSYPKTTQIEPLLQRLNDHGFDISVFGEGKVIIHAIPQVFATYTIDIELVMNSVWGMDDEDPAMLFGHILDEIFGMKACKASITAGQKLSMEEMQKLMQDGIERIDGLFVCQHGRPSVIGTPKGDIDELFGR